MRPEAHVQLVAIGRGDARERAERGEVAWVLHPAELGLRGPEPFRRRALGEAGAPTEFADRSRDRARKGVGGRRERCRDRFLLGFTHP